MVHCYRSLTFLPLLYCYCNQGCVAARTALQAMVSSPGCVPAFSQHWRQQSESPWSAALGTGMSHPHQHLSSCRFESKIYGGIVNSRNLDVNRFACKCLIFLSTTSLNVSALDSCAWQTLQTQKT